jgi:hypothetical protein
MSHTIYQNSDTNVNNYISSTTITLSCLAQNKIWVAWREEITKQGEPTKIPKDPGTGYNAAIPTDPDTYGTLADAIARHNMMKGKRRLWNCPWPNW